MVYWSSRSSAIRAGVVEATRSPAKCPYTSYAILVYSSAFASTFVSATWSVRPFCSSLILLRYKYQEFFTCKAQAVNDLILFQIWPPHPHLSISLCRSEALDDGETSALAAKSYELCNAAANHITTIGKRLELLFCLVSWCKGGLVSLYQEKYMFTRCSAFLCYYLFTASIMHVTNRKRLLSWLTAVLVLTLIQVTVHPTDPQSRLGFTKCKQALYNIQIVWPSAGRALELFRGAKDPCGDASDLVPLTNPSSTVRLKRSAERSLDDSFSAHHSTTNRFDDIHPVERTNPQRQQQQQPNYSSGIEGFAGDGNFLAAAAMSTSASLPSLPPANVVPLSYPWQSGGMNTSNINTHLSTAVLPQLYSTGLVDENIHASRIHSNSDQSTNNPSRRYPSYYDYSSFPSLGSVYDIREPSQVSQPQVQASQMYIPENYSIYSMGPLFLFIFKLYWLNFLCFR